MLTNRTQFYKKNTFNLLISLNSNLFYSKSIFFTENGFENSVYKIFQFLKKSC